MFEGTEARVLTLGGERDWYLGLAEGAHGEERVDRDSDTFGHRSR